MKRLSQKLLKDMSTEELQTESEWHAAVASDLFEKVRELRDRALSADKRSAEVLLRSAMVVEIEADEHRHQSNVLDSVRAARIPRTGVSFVVPETKTYTVRQNI